MITIIFSNQAQLAQSACEKALKKDFPNRDEWNYASFHMGVTPIADLVRECETLSFGIEKKAVVAEDCAFLAATKTKYKFLADDSLDPLARYVENPNEMVDLFLLVYHEKIDLKNPVVKRVKEIGSIKEVPMPKGEEWISYISNYFARRNIDVSRDAVEEFSKRIDGDYARFLTESKKLICYSSGEPIRVETIRSLVAPKLEDDAFAMSNALVKGDVASALKIYKDLKVRSVEEIRLLNMLASQFRFMDEVSYLDAKGLSSRDIAAELGGSPFRVEITLRNLYHMKGEVLQRIQEQLYETEKKILTGQVDAPYAFSLFLANFSLR